MPTALESASDILALCRTVRSLVQALKAIKGPDPGYQAITCELQKLAISLKAIEVPSATSTPYVQEAFRQSLIVAKQCHHVLIPFQESVVRCNQHLSEGGSSTAPMDAYCQARWRGPRTRALALLGEEIVSFRNSIDSSLKLARAKEKFDKGRSEEPRGADKSLLDSDSLRVRVKGSWWLPWLV